MTPRAKRRPNDLGRGPVGRVGHRDGVRTLAECGLLRHLGDLGTSEEAGSVRPTEAEARALWLKHAPSALAEYTAERRPSLDAAALVSLFHETAAVRRGAARWLAWARVRARLDPRGDLEAYIRTREEHGAKEPPRPSTLPPFDVGTPDPNVSAWDRMTPAEKYRYRSRGGDIKDKEQDT